MDLVEKIDYLNSLNTGKIINDIVLAEQELHRLLKNDAQFKADNVTYLASYGEDSRAVKEVIAKLTLDPPFAPDGKKMTVAQTEAWIEFERGHNDELKETIKKQNATTFQSENNRIEIDVIRRRLDGLKGVLALRTAQITFLGVG